MAHQSWRWLFGVFMVFILMISSVGGLRFEEEDDSVTNRSADVAAELEYVLRDGAHLEANGISTNINESTSTAEDMEGQEDGHVCSHGMGATEGEQRCLCLDDLFKKGSRVKAGIRGEYAFQVGDVIFYMPGQSLIGRGIAFVSQSSYAHAAVVSEAPSRHQDQTPDNILVVEAPGRNKNVAEQSLRKSLDHYLGFTVRRLDFGKFGLYGNQIQSFKTRVQKFLRSQVGKQYSVGMCILGARRSLSWYVPKSSMVAKRRALLCAYNYQRANFTDCPDAYMCSMLAAWAIGMAGYINDEIAWPVDLQPSPGGLSDMPLWDTTYDLSVECNARKDGVKLVKQLPSNVPDCECAPNCEDMSECCCCKYQMAQAWRPTKERNMTTWSDYEKENPIDVGHWMNRDAYVEARMTEAHHNLMVMPGEMPDHLFYALAGDFSRAKPCINIDIVGCAPCERFLYDNGIGMNAVEQIQTAKKEGGQKAVDFINTCWSNCEPVITEQMRSALNRST